MGIWYRKDGSKQKYKNDKILNIKKFNMRCLIILKSNIKSAKMN